MTTCILINGPRGVGKDTMADQFIDAMASARKLPIMHQAKLDALAYYSVPPSMFHMLDSRKDVPSDKLEGKTPRQVYIEYGNAVPKADIAMRWAAVAKQFTGYKYLVVPDVRFQEEVEEASRLFGLHQTLLIRLHRPGRDWTGDTGGYCSHVFYEDVHNDKEASWVGEELQRIVKRMML